MKKLLLLLALSVLLSACSAKVGSPEWCKQMEEKPKTDWSLNDAKNYAKHCVFQ